MKFEPVHLPADRQLGGRVSQTMLKHYARCPRSGYLYSLFKGEASTPELVRGRAFHKVIQRAVEAAVEQDEPVIPPDIVKVIVNEVLAEEPVRVEDHDFIREMAYRWASETAVDPVALVACETLFVVEIAGWQVRCRIDYAELHDEGTRLVVKDWKSSRALPPLEEVARRRPDGSLAGKSFQLVLYALALVFGVPVRVEPCAVCGGEGWIWGMNRPEGHKWTDPTPLNMRADCPACGGTGRVETPSPFPVAPRAQLCDLSYVHPAIERRDGRMADVTVTLNRPELEEYRQSLEAVLHRLTVDVESGEWPAVASSEACSECPARRCVRSRRCCGITAAR
jgi:CRISPR/Cas system-associated exonuclease Cas4 (RecB family)